MPVKNITSKIPITHRFYKYLGLGLLGLSVSLSASAKESISLNQAIAKTFSQHPDLIAYGYQYKALAAKAEQAQVASPKVINLEVNDAFGTGDLSGLSAMQTTLSLSWLLEDAQIDSRVKVAKAELQTSDINRRLTALELAANTARLYIVLLTQQEQLKLAKLAEQQTQDMLEQITTRVNAGKSKIVDQYRAKAALAKQTLEVEDLTHEIEASQAQLAAQWQGTSDFSVSGQLQFLPDSKQLKAIIKQLQQHPKMQQFANNQAIARAKASQAKVEAKPSWRVSTGIKHNQELEDIAFTASISVPFANENRNDALISAYRAEEQQQQAIADAWQKTIATDLLLISHKLKHNRHVVEGLTEEVLPALEQASQSAEQAYRSGSYRYTDWFAVQQELVESQQELISAYSQIHLLNIEVERLTGSSLSNN